MEVIDTRIGTMVIVLMQGNMVILAAGISIPGGGTGAVVIEAGIITGDEKAVRDLCREFALSRV
ncbi:MAG: hypothetical protein KGN35_07780 [Betaproteobacteria bacterium]|nr:hypothetical protein [Betaproteobacteria bacterium]